MIKNNQIEKYDSFDEVLNRVKEFINTNIGELDSNEFKILIPELSIDVETRGNEYVNERITFTIKTGKIKRG